MVLSNSMNQQFVFPYLGRVLDRGPEYRAVKERWVHTCVLILLRVWDEGGESGSCTIPRRQGPRSRGGKGGSCPPTFLADNVNLFNVLIIADAYTRMQARGGCIKNL